MATMHVLSEGKAKGPRGEGGAEALGALQARLGAGFLQQEVPRAPSGLGLALPDTRHARFCTGAAMPVLTKP